MNYKKIIAAASALVMVLSFSGCGKDAVSENGDEALSISAVSDISDADEGSEASDASDDSEASATKNDNKKSEKATAASEKKSEKSTDKSASTVKNGGSGNSSGNSSGNNSSSGSSKSTSAVSNSQNKTEKTTVSLRTTSKSNGVVNVKTTSRETSANIPFQSQAAQGKATTANQNAAPAATNKPADNNKPSVTAKPSDDSKSTTPITPDKPAETTPTPTEAPKEEKVYDGEISFNGSPSATGSNVSVEGNKVMITAGGEYIISGSSNDGQIVVDTETEDKVEIILNGVDLTCSNGPAIFINEAKKCIVKIAGETVNYLSDGGKDKVNDGVIFSNDTLKIKGSGRLEIDAVNAHGIASDDDVIIENGEIYINSKKSGIFAHDDITINDGDLTIFGGTNGIKSKGTVHINGGTAKVCGGSKEEKSSIYASAGLYYSGGNVFAAGNMVTAPADDTIRYIVVKWNKGVAADSTVGFVLSGLEFASLTPKNPYKCIMMLSPDIENGDVFTPTVDGEEQGSFDINDGQNLFIV